MNAIMKTAAQATVALALAVAIVATAATALAACPVAPEAAKAGVTRVAAPKAIVLFQPRPGPIKVGALFSLDLSVCATEGEVRAIAVDATMPEHKHGMNYKPVIKPAGTGAFTATGLMFHMPGRWQFAFEVDTTSGRERILHNVTVE